MTPDEIKKLLQWVSANFPNMQEKDLRPTAALWEKLLGDIPYETAEKAVVMVLSTSKYFPTVAEIRTAALKISSPQRLTAAEAWGEVMRAMRRYDIHEEIAVSRNLSPMVAQVVRCFGWREICLSEKPEIIRAQFRQAYETQIAREHEKEVIPSDVRQLINQAMAKMKLLG